MFFVDDGVSGTTLQKPNFMRMERMAEDGEIGTIIVKDLSRFGREQVEMGRLTQVVYSSLGVRFIAIQERVDTLTGEGVEMMPFHNIFNEWYTAQTSKKTRAAWQSKSDNGKRVSANIPFGYVKDTENSEQWLIDGPAAQMVRKICALCLVGKGPSQIARQLEQEKIMIPSAYYESVGRKHAHKVPLNPYFWDQKTIVHILENRQYTGGLAQGAGIKRKPPQTYKNGKNKPVFRVNVLPGLKYDIELGAFPLLQLQIGARGMCGALYPRCCP